MARRGGRAQSGANHQTAAHLKAEMQRAAREEELARRALWEMEYRQRGGQPGDTEFPKMDAATVKDALWSDTSHGVGTYTVGTYTSAFSNNVSGGGHPGASLLGATLVTQYGTPTVDPTTGMIIQGPAKVRFGPPPGQRVSPNHADGRLEAAEHYPVDDPIGWLHRRVSEVTELAPMLGGARG